MPKISDPDTGLKLFYNYIRADVLLEKNKLKKELEKE
jgi:hypothetical protein